MAWSFPVALFFLVIAALLALMTFLAIRRPETPRVGILRIETTRGDRLFVTLLGSAFLCLGWLYVFGADGPPLWGALLLCLAYGAAVSEVMTSLAPQSLIRFASASGEKPAKTMEWIAPIRAQASIASTASGIIGM